MSAGRQPIRWVVGVIVALAAAVLFVRLGWWQLDRWEEKKDLNALVAARLEAPPVPLGELAASPTGDEVRYRRVTTAGTYAGPDVLLRGRSRNGVAGYHVLTALITDDAGTVVVDRGWVPLAVGDDPTILAAAPAHRIEVDGFVDLSQEEGRLAGPDEASLARVSRVDLAALATVLPAAPRDLYVQLIEQMPEPDAAAPRPAPLPEPGEGPHLGYAMQWFLFAAIVVVGYPILYRRVGRRRPARRRTVDPPAAVPDR